MNIMILTLSRHMAADKDGNATLVILTIFFIIFIIIIVSAVVFCGILYFKRENVHQRCTEFAIGMWSGRGKVPEETGSKDASALEKGKREKIPEGWAAYYYNLGWRQCQEEEHDSNESDKTDVGSSKDPHKEKSYRGYREEPRDPEGAASTQPLLGESRAQQEKATAAVFGTSKDQGGDTFHDAKEGGIELKPLDASNLMVRREQQSSSQAEQQGAHTETDKEREEAEKTANKEAEKTAKAAETAEKKARKAAETAEKKARQAAEIKKKGGAEKAERTARAAEEAEKIAIEAANEAERTARQAAEKAQIKARQAAKKADIMAREAAEIKKKGGAEKTQIKAREEAEKAQRAAEEADRKAKEAADKADKIAREAAEKAEKHAREAAAKQAKANK